MITIIKGPRASGKTFIARSLAKEIINIPGRTCIVLDEFNTIYNRGLRYNFFKNEWSVIENINIDTLSEVFDEVIICIAPGCSECDLSYTKNEFYDPFIVDLSGGYKNVFN